MQRVVSMKTLNASFSLESDGVAQFRSLGGREVLVTFPNQEKRDALIRHPWMNLWFESVKPWKGEPASFERFIWLTCRGVPLNGWNARTFQQIGEIWGHFIKLDEVTLRDESFAKGRVLISSKEIHHIDQWIQIQVEGVVFEVRVSEDSSFVSPDEMEELDLTRNLCQKKPRWEASMAAGSVEMQGEDDDVERRELVETNRQEVVGAGWDILAGGAAVHGKDKQGAGGRASQHVRPVKHLMPEKTLSALPGEFESQVGDSLDELDLGLLGEADLCGRDGLGGPVKEAGLVGDVAQWSHDPLAKSLTKMGEEDGLRGPHIELGLAGDVAQISHVSESYISPVLAHSDDIESFQSGDSSQMIRCSQVPSINLMVDLNNADCRRRR